MTWTVVKPWDRLFYLQFDILIKMIVLCRRWWPESLVNKDPALNEKKNSSHFLKWKSQRTAFYLFFSLLHPAVIAQGIGCIYAVQESHVTPTHRQEPPSSFSPVSQAQLNGPLSTTINIQRKDFLPQTADLRAGYWTENISCTGKKVNFSDRENDKELTACRSCLPATRLSQVHGLGVEGIAFCVCHTSGAVTHRSIWSVCLIKLSSGPEWLLIGCCFALHVIRLIDV